MHEDLIKKLEPYFGLQKEDAVNKLNELPLTLTTSEAEDLSEKVMTANTASVKRRYNEAIGKYRG